MIARKQALAVGVAIAALGLGGYGVAAATTGSSSPGQAPDDADGSNEAADSDAPLTGSDLDRAVAAALAEVEGDVIETEVGDDGAAFGVEIRQADGSEVEVNLDAEFNVIGVENDDD